MDWLESIRLQEADSERPKYIAQMGYVKISDRLLDALLPLCPLVEVGSGTGALAQALRTRGGRVVATDNWSSDTAGENWHGSVGRVVCAEASRAVRLMCQTRANLLCAWPSYDEDWCTRAVELLPEGRLFALVSEGRGGCIADDSLFDLLESDFELVEEIEIDTFPGLWDRLSIHRRRTSPC
jgi:hypothetical protein